MSQEGEKRTQIEIKIRLKNWIIRLDMLFDLDEIGISLILASATIEK